MGTKAVAKLLRAAQSGSEPETIGLAPEPEPYHQLSRWSRAVSGPSQAVTTLPNTYGFCLQRGMGYGLLRLYGL